MRRRYIALKIAAEQWQFAVAAGDPTDAKLLQTGYFVRDRQRPLADQLAELFGPLQMTDRLACALSAQNALLRWLQFPFFEPRKIAAAALPELARQLPINLDNRVVFQQPLGAGKALAVAVQQDQLETLLAQFDDNREPLGYLGLAPFCYLAGHNWPDDSLLLCIEDNEVSLSRIAAASVVAVRILPRTTAIDEAWIVQQALLLAPGEKQPLLRLLGSAAESGLAQRLTEAGFQVEAVALAAAGATVAPELTLVASLALAATRAAPDGLNLRSGAYALQNDWQALKRRVWLAALLLIATLMLVAGSGYLQYSQRAAELERLQQQMTTLFQQQFPGEKLQVAAALQLQSKLKELQKKTNRFGTDAPGALQMLLAVSKNIDPALTIDVREYLHNDEGVRLAGSTASFDAVSRLLANLQRDPLFKEVRILDSKQAIDGSRVDFQLQILLTPEKDE